MTTERVRSLRGVIGVLVTLAVLMAVPILWVVRERQKFDERMVNLLSKTDYQALLQACRDLSARVTAGTLEPTVYPVRRSSGRKVVSYSQLI